MTKLNDQIDALEKEVFEKKKALHDLRQQRPAEPVQDYEFHGLGQQPVKLSEVFGDQDDLILIHNMGRGCAYCTLWADGFNGVYDHIRSRAAVVIVSPDTPDVQLKFAVSRGWKFEMLSSSGSSFTEDMGFIWDHDGDQAAAPGFSTFHRAADGMIRRINQAWFGPGDPYSGIWHLFEALDGGSGEWGPKYSYDTAA